VTVYGQVTGYSQSLGRLDCLEAVVFATLLTREWKGRTLLVEVLVKGFWHENRQYASLSALAVAITGTRWNGLAFFGLTRRGGLFQSL
jgi:hypothetical protein